MTTSNENQPSRERVALSPICHAPHCGTSRPQRSLRELATYALLGAACLLAYRATAIGSSGHRQALVERVEVEAPSEPSTITVTGTAEMFVPPDEISADITYREYWRTNHRNKKIGIEKIETKILAAAAKVGIREEDVAIKSLDAWKPNWNYWYYWNTRSDRLTQKTLTVQLTSPAQLTKMIESLKRPHSLRQEAIVNITLSGSSSSKIQEYRKLVKQKAMIAAKEKASYLLGEVKESRGRLVRIRELGDPKAATTSRYESFGYPYFGASHWNGWGGWGSASHTTSSGLGVANTTVEVPAGSQAQGAAGAADAGPGMKPIRLQYSVEATYRIEG